MEAAADERNVELAAVCHIRRDLYGVSTTFVDKVGEVPRNTRRREDAAKLSAFVLSQVFGIFRRQALLDVAWNLAAGQVGLSR